MRASRVAIVVWRARARTHACCGRALRCVLRKKEAKTREEEALRSLIAIVLCRARIDGTPSATGARLPENANVNDESDSESDDEDDDDTEEGTDAVSWDIQPTKSIKQIEKEAKQKAKLAEEQRRAQEKLLKKKPSISKQDDLSSRNSYSGTTRARGATAGAGSQLALLATVDTALKWIERNAMLVEGLVRKTKQNKQQKNSSRQ